MDRRCGRSRGRELLGTITQHRTGLPDRYTLELDYPFRASPAAAPPEFAGPSLPTAVREQWGLRLVPTKGQLKVLVIERRAASSRKLELRRS